MIQLLNLIFANNTILSNFFFFFLVINLHFLIPVVIPEFFIATEELIIPIGIPTKEAKPEMETHLVIAKGKII